MRLGLAWRLAWRELRSGLTGFRIFLASLALGVAAIAAVATVSEAISTALQRDATRILGGDVEMRLVHRFPSDAEAAYIRQNAAALSTSVEMRAMARPAAAQTPFSMVELKAVDGAYPLVGQVDLGNSADENLHTLLAERGGTWGAVVDPALLPKLGLRIGDRVQAGDAAFEIRGTIAQEPDRVASVAAFGPRLMIAAEAVAETNLVQPGSLLRHKTRVLLPDGVMAEAWIEDLRSAFPEAGWRIRQATEASPGIQRFVDRVAMFMSFAGLTALLIGGIGVANAVRDYVDGRAATIATLKCLGAPGRLVMATYLTQVFLLASLGTFLGLVIGAGLPMLLFEAVSSMLPLTLTAGLYPLALMKAAALGLLTALTFSLWPLGLAREVPPANLFRQQAVAIGGRPRLSVMIALALSGLALAAVTVATTDDPWFGAVFVVGALVVLGILRAGAAGVAAAIRRLPRPRSAVFRLALDSLRRPGAPTAMVITSFGAGLTVLVAISLIDSNLRAQISERLPENVPAFFFIDIQDDQVATFDETVASVPGVNEMERAPALRGRIVAIDGVPADEAEIDPDAAWALRGDRGLTYAATKPENTVLASGEWWPADYEGPPLISLADGLAQGFGIGIGDTLTVNVLGRDIQATLASTRTIEWQAVPLAFTIVFSPGVLEAAPHTHIAVVYAPEEVESQLEQAVAGTFSNVTSISTRQAIESVSGLMDRIGLGVRAAAAVTLIAGALVLAGAIAADRQRRQYETVLFKVLGTKRRRIAEIYAAEYGLLGLITAAIAAVLGTLVSFGVVTWLMRLDWSLYANVVGVTVAACTLLTLVLGFAGTWRQLGQKAATYLRNE